METVTGLGQHRPVETAASQRARGKTARRDVPRAAHAVFTPVDRDPVALVEAQNAGRLQDLVPLRRERMSPDLLVTGPRPLPPSVQDSSGSMSGGRRTARIR